MEFLGKRFESKSGYSLQLCLEHHCNDNAATWWLAHERGNWGLYSTSCHKPQQCKILCLRTFLSWTSVVSHWFVSVVRWDSLLFEDCYIQTWPKDNHFIIRSIFCFIMSTNQQKYFKDNFRDSVSIFRSMKVMFLLFWAGFWVQRVQMD